MTQVVIENSVINSPFAEPTRHFRFGEQGITNELVEGRRASSYFVPIAQPRKKGQKSFFETEWVEERIQENQLKSMTSACAWRASARAAFWAFLEVTNPWNMENTIRRIAIQGEEK